MKAKLLTDETLREDLIDEMMYTVGYLALYRLPQDKVRHMIEGQVDLLMPTVKRHIKRRVRASKEV